MSKLYVDQVDPKTATTLTLGTSGDTISIPSGVTIANAGTATGFGGDNTPMFAARRTSGQTVTDNVYTKVEFATEDIDTDSAYDNSSNYRFTVPAGQAGKYMLNVNVSVASNTGVSNAQQFHLRLYKNGSAHLGTIFDGRDGAYGDTFFGAFSYILDCSVSDYFEVYVKFNDGGSGNGGNVQSDATSFSGCKLIT